MAVRSVLCLVVGMLACAVVAEAEMITINSDTIINGPIDDDLLIIGTVASEGQPVVSFLESAVLRGYVHTQAASVLNVLGATFERGLDVRGGSVVNFTAGTTQGDLWVTGATANISGGRMLVRDPYNTTALTVFAGSLNLTGGTVEGGLVVGRSSTASISGGHVMGQIHTSNSSLSILAGRIDSGLIAGGGGDVHLYGGQISGNLIANRGTLHVYGYDLQWDNDRVQGTLADGNPMDLPTEIFEDGQIVLHEVPEPGVLLLLATALGVGFCRRRTTRAL